MITIEGLNIGNLGSNKTDHPYFQNGVREYQLTNAQRIERHMLYLADQLLTDEQRRAIKRAEEAWRAERDISPETLQMRASSSLELGH